MKHNILKQQSPNKLVILRAIAGYSIGILLLLMLLSIFVVIPKINALFEDQYYKDINIELNREVALLENFVEGQKRLLDDLAQFPSVTNAVMLGSDNNSVEGLLKNVVIGGQKAKLILQDIEGNVLVKTTDDLQGNYDPQSTWIKDILKASTFYNFQLLSQSQDSIHFKISVPVLYNGYVEGVLSGEIFVTPDEMFINQRLNHNTAINLTQQSTTVGTSTHEIELPRETTLKLEDLDLVFTYLTDDAPILKRGKSIQNLILGVLLVSLALAFILFTLLSYSGLLEKIKLKNTNENKLNLYGIPLLIGIIGVIASILSFFLVFNAKQASIENNFVFESKEHVQEIRENLKTYLGILDSVNAFFGASQQVNRQDFKTFVDSFLMQHKTIKAIEWIPKVTHQQRKDFEYKAQQNGFTDFSIKEVNENRVLTDAPYNEQYYPVYYVEPLKNNEKALGFNISSSLTEFGALTKALESGEKVATGKVPLVGEKSSKAGIFIFRPVFHHDNDFGNKEKNLQGFTSISIKVDDLVGEVLEHKNNQFLAFIQDITSPELPETLHGTPKLIDSFSRVEIINVAGRTWRIEIYNKDIDTRYIWSAWGLLASGLIFSGLIVLGLIYLIRKREQVEQLVIQRTAELSASEEHHRAVVELAVDGLITLNKSGIIERFNQAAEEIFGYSASEVIGKNVTILIPESSHEASEYYFNNIQQNSGEQLISIESYIGNGKYPKGKHKNGNIFPVEVSVSEIKLSSTIKYSGIVRDISERVAYEKEREQFIEQLTDSNEELERFAFVCSHDLQEPLRMIRSFSEKLQEHIKDDLEHDEKGKKYFNFVIDGAIRAQALINDILTYSSISNDIKQREDVNIGDLIDVIKKNARDFTEGENNTPEITYDVLPNLIGNKTQLFQLFQNLINNGIKYQKPDAKAHVHISVKDANECWRFSVIDNGIGMDERHFKKIFEVFQRLHRRSQYAGTGVGLSICKKVVERHGGTIWVESEKGIGSTFYFTLLKT